MLPHLGEAREAPRAGELEHGGAADLLERSRFLWEAVTRQFTAYGQVWREFDAHYEMQVYDGTVISVRNRVLVDGDDPATRYARSVVWARTAAGPHAWVMRRLLVGTLESLRPAKAAVRVKVYVLE
jgi:hypothetical protein